MLYNQADTMHTGDTHVISYTVTKTTQVTYGLVWFSSILLGGVSPRTLLIDTLRVLSESEYDTPIWISPVTSSLAYITDPL